jgi:hypothetical protein
MLYNIIASDNNKAAKIEEFSKQIKASRFTRFSIQQLDQAGKELNRFNLDESNDILSEIQIFSGSTFSLLTT